jgi:hypothetical protein
MLDPRAVVLKKDMLAMSQGLFISREKESVKIIIQDEKTEIEVRVIIYPPCGNP